MPETSRSINAPADADLAPQPTLTPSQAAASPSSAPAKPATPAMPATPATPATPACAPAPALGEPRVDARRQWLRQTASLGMGGAVASALAHLGACAAPAGGGGVSGSGPASGAGSGGGSAHLRFKPVVIARDDSVHVPEGYSVTVLLPWGDPVGLSRGLPPYRNDGANTADEQALQAGMHHDGMQFFPNPWGARRGIAVQPDDQASSERGYLAINHEYVDHGLLFADAMANWSLQKVRKSQRAVGVSIVEVQRVGPRWTLQRPSPNAQRIHAETPVRIAGPAAGHDAMKTARSTTGRAGLGTLACAGSGWTPWGTYLCCEQNFNYAFKGRAQPSSDEARYGVSASANVLRWGDVDQRFDVERNPNEPNHFGWVVEIDPYDPSAPPVKRTALGRFKHESAAPALARDGRVAFYMADEQAFEYLYKFVTARPWDPVDRNANRDLLDQGTLYVARFNADGSGQWIELVHGRNGLTPAAGFASQADVVIRTRQAGDVVGATRLDRPQWTAVEPTRGTVWCALTGNPERGLPGRPGSDATNPKSPNLLGHLLSLDELGADPTALAFRWQLPSLSGDAVANPDGLVFGPGGLLWVQTDISPVNLLQGAFAQYGNNQVLAIDPATGEARRFLTGPRGSEIAGACFTPDGTTMFVNIQHPGEVGFNGVDPSNPRRLSIWPDGRGDSKPRSATIAIRRIEGGVIGT